MIKYIVDLLKWAFSSREKEGELEQTVKKAKVATAVHECPGCKKIRTDIRDTWYFPPMSERVGYQEREIIEEVYCKECEQIPFKGTTLKDHLSE